MYLTREAIETTLRFIATIPASEVVFDYSEPIENYSAVRRANLAELNERVASLVSLGSATSIRSN